MLGLGVVVFLPGSLSQEKEMGGGFGCVWKSGVVLCRRSLWLLAGLRTQVLSAQGWPEERSVCLKACLNFPDVISACKPCYLSTLNPRPGHVEMLGPSNFRHLCWVAEVSEPSGERTGFCSASPSGTDNFSPRLNKEIGL